MGISFNASSLLSGNGIDVNSVVSQIQAAQSGELTTWKSDLTTLQTQATAISSIESDLSNLQSAVQNLAGANGALSAVTATSSESAILTATAQTGATAGNYTVVVDTLASAGTLYTDEVSSATTSILPTDATGGELNLVIGGTDGTGGTAADIAITAGTNDTLTTLASYINTQSASNNWGITAQVVSDASGYRLAIYSQATGEPGNLALAAGDGSNTTNLTFDDPVGGTNATVTINGIPYASTSNTVTGAIPDVTLTLVSQDADTPVTLTVGADSTTINNAINNFVTDYNTVIGDINTQFTANAATNLEGPLGADTYLRDLQTSLMADVNYTATDATSVSNGLTNLAALGISMNNDGTLTVNEQPIDTSTQYSPGFSDVLAADPSGVQNFFTNTNSTGFADTFSADLTNLTDPTTGFLNADLTSNQSQQTTINTDITNFQTQLAAQKVQLDQQFEAVNTSLEQYPITLDEITEILESMSSTGSTSGTTTSTSTNTTPTSGNDVSSTSSSS
jgi:flagellar hook-associated protein 2